MLRFLFRVKVWAFPAPPDEEATFWGLEGKRGGMRLRGGGEGLALWHTQDPLPPPEAFPSSSSRKKGDADRFHPPSSLWKLNREEGRTIGLSLSSLFTSSPPGLNHGSDARKAKVGIEARGASERRKSREGTQAGLALYTGICGRREAACLLSSKEELSWGRG